MRAERQRAQKLAAFGVTCKNAVVRFGVESYAAVVPSPFELKKAAVRALESA